MKYKKEYLEQIRFKVVAKFEQGVTLKTIAKNFSISQGIALSIITSYAKLRLGPPDKRVDIGYKDEAYYSSEKEMMKGIPTYTYDKLSVSEKAIYKKLRS